MSIFRASFWRRALGLVEPLAERRLEALVRSGEIAPERARERRGMPTRPRPEGLLLWCHARGVQRALALAGALAQLRERRPDISILMTTRVLADDRPLAARLPERVILQFLPHDRPQAVARFLSHWQPDVCLWSDTPEQILTLDETLRRGIPCCLLPGEETDAWTARRIRGRLRRMDRIVVHDTGRLAQVREAGARADAVLLLDPLREGLAAPPVDPAERERLARLLEGRPLWLAAGVPLEEVDAVLAAHRKAKSRAPGLALVILPAAGADMQAIRNRLDSQPLPWLETPHLAPGMITAEILLADGAEALAKWHHVATVSYLGGTLTPGGGQSPLPALALGSAVVHGPHTGLFADLFEEIDRRGAAIRVDGAEALAEAVGTAIAPGTAAELAHAGWTLLAEGAAAADRLAEELDLLADMAEARR